MSSWESHKSETEGLLYYCEPSKKVNSTNVLALDLDGTIIKPASGKKFPESIDDWFLAYNIKNMKKIINYSKKGYKIVIMTNQKGIFQGKGKLTFDDFKVRWTEILKSLNVPAYILLAPQDDFYRKPATGMWDFMETHLNGDIKVNRDSSLFIGDAAGRPKDHSDADIKFAINVGVKFMTPEEFFEDSKDFPFDSLVENLKGFSPQNYIKSNDLIKKIHQDNEKSWTNIEKIAKSGGKNVLMMIGSPASGKSSLAKLIKERLDRLEKLEKLEKLERLDKSSSPLTIILSLDIEKTKAKLKKKLINCIDKDNLECSNVIIDSTNGTKKVRKEWIDIIKKTNPEVNIFGIFMNLDKDVVMHFNELRKLRTVVNPEYPSKNIPDVAIHTFWKKYESPVDDEGFNSIIDFRFEPNFKDEEDKKQFMNWF
jgi:bifunctional polynucleotide phosphatase/kinase